MARNVSSQPNLSGKATGQVDGNPVNVSHKNYHFSQNTFPSNYRLYDTHRYGDIHPFFVFNSVPKDTVPFNNKHELRSYTLSAPLMSDIIMHKDYFQVPMKAILPRNWNQIYANPVKGDDVPFDAYCTSGFSIRYIVKEIVQLLDNYKTISLQNLSAVNTLVMDNIIRYVLLLESISSAGSLLNTLGYSCSAIYHSRYSRSGVLNIDEAVDLFFPRLFYGASGDDNSAFGIEVTFIIDSTTTKIYTLKGAESNRAVNGQTSIPVVSLRRMLEMMRENPNFSISYQSANSGVNPPVTDWKTRLTAALDFVSNLVSSIPSDATVEDEPIDLSRLLAYQIVCSHFYTNDHIDDIYDTDLFLDNAQSCIMRTFTNSVWPTFLRNGISLQYDVFSDYIIKSAFGSLINQFSTVITSQAPTFIFRFCYLSLIFSYRKSLKYGDYFTGARAEPLAVGQVTAPVVANGVSAIDMTINIQKQRFLNAVNRFGARVDNYVRGLFGVNLPSTDKIPKFLVSQSFGIGGFEVENTGSEQRDANSITTILKSSQGKYAFENFSDNPCIYLGLATYESRRAYVRTADRHFFHNDRYDMFNPFMQYTGDQEIYGSEIDTFRPMSKVFAYTLRYMEYKQRFDRASGGFVRTLKNWSMTTDNEDLDNMLPESIDSDFIRSSNVELDRFYSSLTGYSLGTYFHFIVRFDNLSSPNREMEYTPSIL